MSLAKYHMTNTARENLKDAVRDTKRQWGFDQAVKYKSKLMLGLQYIADNHRNLRTPYRKGMTENTQFHVHLVEHRYVAFVEHDIHNIIIVGLFHEKMNIPKRLQDMYQMTQLEIDAIKRIIISNV